MSASPQSNRSRRRLPRRDASRHICCGRPLYDYGMLDLRGVPRARARRAARRHSRGDAVVGPSRAVSRCSRTRSPKLLPERPGRQAPLHTDVPPCGVPCEEGYEPPPLHGTRWYTGTATTRRGRRAAKAPARGDGGRGRELGRRLLRHGRRVGLREVALRRLDRLWRARAVPGLRGREDPLVVTAGFSCHSQIEQATERRALHLAEVLQLAHGKSSEPPQPSRARRAVRAGALAAGAVALLGA